MEVAIPAADGGPPAGMLTTLKLTVPLGPGVKVILLLVPAPAVMAALSTVQTQAAPGRGGNLHAA